MMLSGQTRSNDRYFEMRDKTGCYLCPNLKGTMLNTITNKTVAICTELRLHESPHPKVGCQKGKMNDEEKIRVKTLNLITRTLEKQQHTSRPALRVVALQLFRMILGIEEEKT